MVPQVAHKWKDLGVQLLRPDQQRVLDIIELDHPRNAVECCKRLFQKWLDTDTNATWDQLIAVLRSPSIGLDHFATQLIEHIKSIEREVYSSNLHAYIGSCHLYCKVCIGD